MRRFWVIGAVGLLVGAVTTAVTAAPLNDATQRSELGETSVPAANGAPMQLCSDADIIRLFALPVWTHNLRYSLAVGGCEAAEVLPLSAETLEALMYSGQIPDEALSVIAKEKTGPTKQGTALMSKTALLFSLSLLGYTRSRAKRSAQATRARA